MKNPLIGSMESYSKKLTKFGNDNNIEVIIDREMEIVTCGIRLKS